MGDSAPLGRIREFELGSKNWTTYVSRLNQFFIANNVEDAKRVPILVRVVGDDTYEQSNNSWICVLQVCLNQKFLTIW